MLSIVACGFLVGTLLVDNSLIKEVFRGGGTPPSGNR
jgi:hypothetical protein